MSRLGDVFNLVGGGTPTTSVEEYWGSGTPWISSADIDDNGHIAYRRKVTSLGVANSTTNIVPKGTVIVVTRVGLGKVAQLTENTCFSQDIQALIAKENSPVYNPGYLMYQLLYIMQTVKYSGRGTTISGITKKQLADVSLYLPPLSEQERIVARIEELFSQLDAGVETLKKIKAQLAVYRQAVLKEAFGGICDYVLLGTICDRVFDGPFGSNLKTVDYVQSGIPVVRLENLKNGWFDDSKWSYVTPEKYEIIKNHTVFQTDLIMSTFIFESIKICQLPSYVSFAVNKADCVGIRLKDEYEPLFVMYYLSSKEAYDKLVHQVHGATRPRVNTKQIKAIQIPSVVKGKQKKIVEQIESRLSVCDSIEQTVDTAMQQAEAMRQSILKDAFEGRL